MTMMNDQLGLEIARGEAPGNLPFSRYIAVGDWIYVSGVVGRDPNTSKLEENDLEVQTRVALRIIGSILEKAGSNLTDVVKTTIYTTDMSRFAEINVAYRGALGAGLPARTCVEVSRLPDPEAQVEIDVVAYRQEQR